MMVRKKWDRIRVSTDMNGDVGKTKQSMKKDCDINVILGRYAKGQVVDHVAKYNGQYGDFSAMSFQDAMNVVAKAQEAFADLDSSVRKRFGQSPSAFLDFAMDPANAPEMVKMGLMKAPQAPPGAPPASSGGSGGTTHGST